MALIRLDKLLAQSGERTRSEAARLMRAGCVSVDGVTVRDPATKVDATRCDVRLNGQSVLDEPFQYYMLHKPAGILTAARDRHAATVMDLVPEALRRREVLPVGRLDKDTTGLLLLTNDGELAHRLLSPKRHVWKTYLATVNGLLTPEDAAAFAQGMALSDFMAKPAELQILTSAPDESCARVRLSEGKLHQVKRMFAARGRDVVALHREAFGLLQLDVPVGEYRPLTGAEIAALRAQAQDA
ncbi:MAG: pseudouridine synthase [Candidatus Limiplasma sp.]|nr:pseudouridine synthase [Candidatus Limiplasma sp.]